MVKGSPGADEGSLSGMNSTLCGVGIAVDGGEITMFVVRVTSGIECVTLPDDVVGSAISQQFNYSREAIDPLTSSMTRRITCTRY